MTTDRVQLVGGPLDGVYADGVDRDWFTVTLEVDSLSTHPRSDEIAWQTCAYHMYERRGLNKFIHAGPDPDFQPVTRPAPVWGGGHPNPLEN
jgi:hypothetical protein